jgi:hypothetical protein
MSLLMFLREIGAIVNVISKSEVESIKKTVAGYCLQIIIQVIWKDSAKTDCYNDMLSCRCRTDVSLCSYRTDMMLCSCRTNKLLCSCRTDRFVYL